MNKKLLVSALLTTGLTFAASGAYAGAVATSYLNLSNIRLTDGLGNKLVQGGANPSVVFVSTINNNGDTSATLNGVNDNHSDDQAAAPGGLNIIAASVGGAYADNSFTRLAAPSDASVNYAHGDALLTGAIVNIGGAATPNAQAQTLAEISLLSGNNNGSAAGNNVGVQGTVSFTALATTTINVAFTAEAYVRSFLSADLAGTVANASTTWTMTLRNLTTNVNQVFTPTDINISNSATIAGQDFVDTFNGDLSRTFNIATGNNYQLTIAHTSSADANTRVAVVPEPVSLMIMSLGLLGLGFSKRSKIK